MTALTTLIQILDRELTREDVRGLTYADLSRLESLLHHWREMTSAERLRRTQITNEAFDRELASVKITNEFDPSPARDLSGDVIPYVR